MGIQQGAPPHLSTHHTTNILLSSEGAQDVPSSAPSLPSINADVSDFFSQLENSAENSSTAVLTINSFSASEGKLNRFHPYESRTGQGYTVPATSAMNQASSPAVQSYLNYNNANFNDGLIYQKQKAWAVDNGLRVHERGGMGDKILYNFSTLLVIVGGVMWIQTVYKMSFPPKN